MSTTTFGFGLWSKFFVSSKYERLLLNLLLAALVVTTLGGSKWQDVTNFHPYCVRLFKTCVETSHSDGSGTDYFVSVGICGNKMAICTFSGTLSWPWSIISAGQSIAFASVNATTRLTTYRNALTSTITTISPHCQNMTNFSPDCGAESQRCVNSSQLGGIEHNSTAGVCGHGGRLGRWPYGNDSSVFWHHAWTDARLQFYRGALTSTITTISSPWQNMTDFLPDCRAEFKRCVNSSQLGGIEHNSTARICGHGMSICTERHGRWPYGNDSSVYWQHPCTDARLQLYRNVYHSTNVTARNWHTLTAFLPMCRQLMTQCVALLGGPESDAAIGYCGNQMAICTFENVYWPFTDDATSAYREPYDGRIQRYINVIKVVTSWQDIKRFSLFCTHKFFECVYASNSTIEHFAVGVCGNRMSFCTFKNNKWPSADEVPTTFDSYSARLEIYRRIFKQLSLHAPSYSKFLPVQINPINSILPTTTILTTATILETSIIPSTTLKTKSVLQTSTVLQTNTAIETTTVVQTSITPKTSITLQTSVVPTTQTTTIMQTSTIPSTSTVLQTSVIPETSVILQTSIVPTTTIIPQTTTIMQTIIVPSTSPVLQTSIIPVTNTVLHTSTATTSVTRTVLQTVIIPHTSTTVQTNTIFQTVAVPSYFFVPWTITTTSTSLFTSVIPVTTTQTATTTQTQTATVTATQTLTALITHTSTMFITGTTIRTVIVPVTTTATVTNIVVVTSTAVVTSTVLTTRTNIIPTTVTHAVTITNTQTATVTRTNIITQTAFSTIFHHSTIFQTVKVGKHGKICH